MREIVNSYALRTIATILLYGLYSLFVNKLLIFPFPLYEIIFLLLSVIWYVLSYRRQEDVAFFRVQLFLSILWLFSSSLWLEFIFSHEKIENVFYIFPILEVVFVVGFISLVVYYEYFKKMRFKYVRNYILFSFMLFSKFYNLYL
jgi:hypothetical protein